MRWLCTTLFFICLPAMAGEWHSVQAMSKLGYIATYEKEPIEGKFQQFTVLVQTNTKTAMPEKLSVQVSMASVDMAGDDINETIRGVEWFDITRFSNAEFNAQAVDKKDATHYVAHGVLKLKGVEKKMDLPFVWKADAQKILLSGEVLLKRNEFGIGSGEWASGNQIGLDVNVIFSVVLSEKK